MVTPVRTAERREISYADDRWRLFEGFRESAREIMRALSGQNIASIVHGSVARGDVDADSDVDVMVPRVVQSYRVELALREAGLQPSKREIVMATPWQLPKAHLYLEGDRVVSFPLIKPRPLEIEFYRFGGAVDPEQVARGERAAGVDKRLLLIEPTDGGHVESQVSGREAEVAKRVGVSLDIVRERVKVLTRRAKIGHTGIFLQQELGPDENFEKVFGRIAASNSAVKLRLRQGS